MWKERPLLPAVPEQGRQMLKDYESYRVQRKDVEDIINSLLGETPRSCVHLPAWPGGLLQPPLGLHR